MPSMSSRLPFHEWLVVSLFCSVLLLLASFAFLGRSHAYSSQPPSPSSFSQSSLPETPLTHLEVKVEGAVAHPGVYRLPLKTSLKELLAQAEPLPTADLSELSWRKKLRDQQTVTVPEKREITIYLDGAVKKPGAIKILSGTRYQELLPQLDCLEEADLRAIKKKKKFLQEGACVYIPSKVRKGKNSDKNPKLGE